MFVNFSSATDVFRADSARIKIRAVIAIIAAMTLHFLGACGGGSKQNSVTPPPSPAKYTIGGTVSGLSGTGLVLQDNGSDNLTINTNGGFTFATAVASGDPYDITILTQPSNPSQSCVVSNASGTIGSVNVGNVTVDCGSGSTGDGHNEWTWMAGSKVINQSGVYGTEGTPSVSNIPGARSSGSTWTDAAGDFWLFGGVGIDSGGSFGEMNDLWRFGSGGWTWMGGSNLITQPGNYGTQGVAAPGNIPGARGDATSGTDKSGNLWLFGGYGADSTGGGNPLNDLWEYSGGEWTWISGSNVHSQKGIYGSIGLASPSNVPGARFDSQLWVDTSGDLWLFGGTGLDSTGAVGELNDLWKFSAGEWTWMSGSNIINQPGVYGTQGVGVSTNMPGGRSSAAVWTDAAGNLWLFGGSGYDSTGAGGALSDVWRYSAGAWSWMGGSKFVNEAASYGTQGVASPSNTPGARGQSAVWLDTAGDLWIFGGSANGGSNQVWFNDVWKYSGGQWTWVGGTNTTNQPAVYGTLGVPSASNIPGARQQSGTWIDQSGRMWLFGGVPYTYGSLNDFWMYQP